MPDDAIAVRIEESEGRQTLRVQGEICLPTAATLRRALIEALEGGRETVMELGEVTNADLSGLQLLCSAHRTCLKRGVSLTMGAASEKLRGAALLAGYEARTAVCPFRRDGVCLWKG
jgi:anti-anti-sigma factor